MSLIAMPQSCSTVFMPHQNVLIRGSGGRFVVVDASTSRPLAGPYRTLGDAHAKARRLVTYGEVWRETVDASGRPVGRLLLELRASTIR